MTHTPTTFPFGSELEFDIVVTMDAAGTMTERPDLYAPESPICDPETGTAKLPDGWRWRGGLTGQQGGGDTLHDSELFADGCDRALRQDVRDSGEPVTFCLLQIMWAPEHECEHCGESLEWHGEGAGWATESGDFTCEESLHADGVHVSLTDPDAEYDYEGWGIAVKD